jgi:hypothetical protein
MNFKLIDVIELYLGNFAVLMQFVCQETFMCNTSLVFHSDSIEHSSLTLNAIMNFKISIFVNNSKCNVKLTSTWLVSNNQVGSIDRGIPKLVNIGVLFAAVLIYRSLWWLLTSCG